MKRSNIVIGIGALIGFSLGMLLAYLVLPRSTMSAAGWGGESIVAFTMYCSYGILAGAGGVLGGIAGYLATSIRSRRR